MGKEVKFGIALLKKNNEISGIRILTTDFENTKKIEDKELKDLKGLLLFNMEIDNKGNVVGLARESGTYKVINGKKTPSLKKYPIIDKDTNKIENNSFVILCRTKQGDVTGFAMSNANGKVKFMTEEETIKLVESAGGKNSIANGTLTKEGFIRNTVGYYYEVEKIGIIDKQEGKEWDLSNENKKAKEHINAILENKQVINKVTAKQSIEVIKELLKDDKFLDDLGNSVEKENTKRLGELLTEFYNKYEIVLNNCEKGKEFKKGIALIMKNLTETNFIKEVKKYIQEKTKLEDCI